MLVTLDSHYTFYVIRYKSRFVCGILLRKICALFKASTRCRTAYSLVLVDCDSGAAVEPVR